MISEAAICDQLEEAFPTIRRAVVDNSEPRLHVFVDIDPNHELDLTDVSRVVDQVLRPFRMGYTIKVRHSWRHRMQDVFLERRCEK